MPIIARHRGEVYLLKWAGFGAIHESPQKFIMRAKQHFALEGKSGSGGREDAIAQRVERGEQIEAASVGTVGGDGAAGQVAEAAG